MIEKKRLLTISELKLAGKIEDMNDEQMQEYEQLLMAFVENFPNEEEKIKASLVETLNKGLDLNVPANHLRAMCKTLGNIHADDLARECRKRIDEFKGTEREPIEAYVTTFLSSVASLSIDIQMAKYLKTSEKVEEKGGGAAEVADKPVSKPTDAQSADGEKTILAVDDAAISLSILRKNLQESPYKLICVNSGKDALLFLQRHKPDMFILDIEMPKMNGYELAKKIKESGHKAPIVFLTGNCSREHVMRAIKAGGVDFVVKPINKEILVRKLYKHLYTQVSP